jgi:hypothetical protein
MSFLVLLLIIQTKNNSERFTNSCNAKITMIFPEKKAKLELIILPPSDGRSGIISISGLLSASGTNGAVKKIRRDVYFSMLEYNKNYVLTSTDVKVIRAIDQAEPSDLESILPDFFIYKGMKVRFGIQSQSNGGYMFFIGERPIFFCENGD